MTVVLLSDMLINPTYGASLLEPFMIVSLLSYVIIFFMGKKAGSKTGIIRFSCGYGILSALLFHSLTCSFAWWTNPFYAKNLTGLIQALTLGEPGYAPAYLFLRNSILSSIFFSVLFHWVATYELKKFKSEESKGCVQNQLQSRICWNQNSRCLTASKGRPQWLRKHSGNRLPQTWEHSPADHIDWQSAYESQHLRLQPPNPKGL